MTMMTQSGRLSEYDHDEIRAAYHAGVPVEQLAVEYHRRAETIRTIIRRKSPTANHAESKAKTAQK